MLLLKDKKQASNVDKNVVLDVSASGKTYSVIAKWFTVIRSSSVDVCVALVT